MKKKLKDLTIGECASICKKHRNENNSSMPCEKCSLGGYNCGAIFGMKLPEYFASKVNMDDELILEVEIEF